MGTAGRTTLALAAVLALLAAGPAASCRKRPAGTCAEDIDCPAGYDCRAGACVKRPPAPGTTPATEVAAPVEQPLSPPAADIPAAPGRADASAPADGSAPGPRPRRKAAPPSPAVPPPAIPPAPPQGPLPMWKQRLKNS